VSALTAPAVPPPLLTLLPLPPRPPAVPKPPPPPPSLSSRPPEPERPTPPALPVHCAEMLPPGPAVVPEAPASIFAPESTSTLPATRKMTGLLPWSLSTWLLLSVRPLSRTTMTCGPLESICVTLFVKSSEPSVQLVLVMVPAVESTVVVPAAVQFQVGEVWKFVAHCAEFTFTDGGSGVV